MTTKLEHPQTFLFMGRSGSGKGTQVRLLKSYLEKTDPARETFHIYPGDRFREFIRRESYTSLLAREIFEQGALLPEFLSVWMWANDLVDNLKKDQHVIFDGTPRKAHEAPVLHSALADFYKRQPSFLFVLNVSRDVAIERLKARGRKDDVEIGDIEQRMRWYDTDVVPTIEFFRKNSFYRVIDLDGDQLIEKIHQELLTKLEAAWQS